MGKILDRLPITTRDEIGVVGGETVRFKEAEIIVWVSVRTKDALTWDPAAPRFPAILDTGHTHNFSIQQQHLARWAGIHPKMLDDLGMIRQAGRRIPLHAANIWLHRNEPGQRTSRSDQPPLLLELPRGIAVYPDIENYPRLPLLGLRSLLTNRLQLAIDGENRRVNLRTPDWCTRLLGWIT